MLVVVMLVVAVVVVCVSVCYTEREAGRERDFRITSNFRGL